MNLQAFLIYLLESSVCLGVFYLFYITVLHNQPSYQYNRFYLLSASLLSFIIPLLEIPVGIASPGQEAVTSGKVYVLDEAVAQTAVHTARIEWPYILSFIYLAGVCLAMYFFIKQLYRLYCIVREGSIIPKGHYLLVNTNGKLPASSFFHYLFWDNTRTLQFNEQQQILTHEEAHILQKHSYDVLYMATLKILFWFQPLVYLYDKALIETHEFAADAEVIKRTHPREYTRLLTKRLFEGLELSLVNHFYKSQTLKRIEMMKLMHKKMPWYKYVLVAPVMLSVLITFSCQPDEETINREAVAQSYEEVQAALKQVGGEIRVIYDKYFPENNGLVEVREKESEVETLKRANPSNADLQKFEDLIAQREQLYEKLIHLPDPDGVYTVVENQPEPSNGLQAFYNFIAQHLRYPAQARRMGIEGKVFVQFTVNEYGELTDFKTLKGIGAGCDEEATRVLALENAPKWNPGTTDGKPVKVKMVLPVTFKLDGPWPDRAEKHSSKNNQDKIDASDGKNLSEMVIVGYTPQRSK